MKISTLMFVFIAFSVPYAPVMGAEGDSTITIRKGERISDPDFKIESGTEEVSGEPVAGSKESYDSWKKACNDWKKEMREMNGASLLTASCGAPRAQRDSSSRTTQKSVGTYKIKVRIRDAEGPRH